MSHSFYFISFLMTLERVFLNETLDATHLAEFHQIEGMVADYNFNPLRPDKSPACVP